ncbi:MAG TPA: class I SAM-dependent methyltransferase [Leptolinea sp.]
MTGNDSRENVKKWNSKYTNDDRFHNAPVRKLILQYSSLLPASGWALEIAGGIGKTTDYLQNMGLNVVEMDISFEALRKAQRINPAPNYVLADARSLPLGGFEFDVICNFYFLERSVFNIIRRNLKPGGLLFFETMTLDILSVRPEIPPSHLLEQGELQRVFPDWELLHYFEGWVDSDHGKRKSISQIVARKPL